MYISILGVPCSGKSEVLKDYKNTIALGDYAHSLPENKLKDECKEYWIRGETFSADLTLKLLESHSKIEGDAVLLDGTPRNEEQAKIIVPRLDLKYCIEFVIDEKEWCGRVEQMVKSRINRNDSTREKLIKRRAEYFKHRESIMSYFKEWKILYNTEKIETKKEQFKQLLEEITNSSAEYGN